MVQFHQPLRLLKDAGVDFVVIGGIAAILHGGSMSTFDVDVCTPMSHENLAKIITAFKGLNPRHRMHPAKPPLPEDAQRLKGFKNLNLFTDIGVIDLLGELPGVGSFDDLKDRTIEIDLGGFRCRVLDLQTLIAAKTAAGRDKDKLSVLQLKVLQKNRESSPELFSPPPSSG